jgi:CheY-like chemotaxis protein
MSEPCVVALIVDDDPSVLRLTAAAFARLGVTVHTAGSAASALTLLNLEPAIRLVFSDVHMPIENGVVLARQIRQSYPEISVVLTSGEDVPDAPQGVRFVPKPWRLADLRSVLAGVAA